MGCKILSQCATVGLYTTRILLFHFCMTPAYNIININIYSSYGCVMPPPVCAAKCLYFGQNFTITTIKLHISKNGMEHALLDFIRFFPVDVLKFEEVQIYTKIDC